MAYGEDSSSGLACLPHAQLKLECGKPRFASVLAPKMPKMRQKQAEKRGLCLLVDNPSEIAIC
jgi:hypothetical protein